MPYDPEIGATHPDNLHIMSDEQQEVARIELIQRMQANLQDLYALRTARGDFAESFHEAQMRLQEAILWLSSCQR